MATLTALPPELLHLILQPLNPFELEIVARTFNRILYHAAHPRLAPYISWLAHVKRVRKILDPMKDAMNSEGLHPNTPLPTYPGYFPPLDFALGACLLRLTPQLAETLGLDGGFETVYTKYSPPDLRSWMKLDGSFEWLRPLPKMLQDEMSPHQGEGNEPVATQKELDAFLRQTKELGLTLPPAFCTFVRSNELQYRMPSSMAWYFKLGRLIKCSVLVDRGNGGYVLRFHTDQQSCAFSYLYLNKDGDNCVMWSIKTLREASQNGGDDESDEELNDNEDVSDDEDDNEKNGETQEPLQTAPSLAQESQKKDPQSQQEGSSPTSLREFPDEDEDDDGNANEHEDSDSGSGDDPEGIGLQALSFEEYLATTYYEEMLWFLAHGFTFDPPQGLKDYAKHVYLPIRLTDREEIKNRSQGI